jgi:ankyrin repeat protein
MIFLYVIIKDLKLMNTSSASSTSNTSNTSNVSNIKKLILKGDFNVSVGSIKLLHYLTQTHDLNHDLIKNINKKLIKNALNIIDENGNNPLHLAAQLNDLELLKYYIKINNLLDVQNSNGCSVVWYIKDNDFIKELINDKIINVHHKIRDHLTLMHLYIQKNDLDMVNFLIDHKYDLNYPIETPPLMMAIILNKINIIKLLLNNGANPNILDKNYYRPLLLAILHNNFNVTKLLIENGADVNYYGPENMEHPVLIAINKENNKIIKLLLDNDIDMNVQNKFLETPVHYMYYTKKHKLIPLNLRIKMINGLRSVNLKDIEGNTILCYLIFLDNWKDYEKILKTKKLKIFEKNKQGIKPLDGIAKKDLKLFFDLVVDSYLHQLINKNKTWFDELDLELIKKSPPNSDLIDKLLLKIQNGSSYPKGIEEKIKFKLPIYKSHNINTFNSSPVEEALYTICILKDHPEIKIPLCNDKEKDFNKLKNKIISEAVKLVDRNNNLSDTQLSYFSSHLDKSKHFTPYLITWLNENSFITTPYLISGTKDILLKYPQTKLIFYKLSIVIGEQLTHSNLLIYDIDRKFIERFDPYGNVPYASEIMDEVLELYFKEQLNLKYYSPKDTVNGISFQMFGDENNEENRIKGDPGGFCLAWSMFYLELRLLNLHLNPKKLIKIAVLNINKLNMKFIDYIRNYASNLDQRKNKLLELAKIPKEEWYRLYMSDEHYEAYLNMVQSEIEKLL